MKICKTAFSRFVSNDVGIDLARPIRLSICAAKGIVVNEPSVVAVNQ